MSRGRRTVSGLVGAALALGAVLGVGVAPVRAAEYELESSATYEVDPDAGSIDVTVEVRFTNTTPDPPGRFSVFTEVKLAVHDQGTDFSATDEEGDLEASAAVESDVNVLTVELRDDLRHEETAEFVVRYRLQDGDTPLLRVRESAVIFPAWSFGTSGEVRVSIPATYGVHVDGDRLRAGPEGLVSGPIEDPSQWLALVKAVSTDPAFESLESTAALGGGTAEIEVRSFADDPAWGQDVLDLVTRALPLLEEEIGIPYPVTGRLTLTQTVGVDATGLGEPAASAGGEILVALDQPSFTIVHQLAHAWLSDDLVESKWIREGMASELADRVVDRLEVDRPFDPAEVAEERADAAFPMDAWPADAGPDAEAYGYAESWRLLNEIRARVGAEGLRAVLARVTGSVGPYRAAEVSPDEAPAAKPGPRVPLTSRSFLDHLEAGGDEDFTELFRQRVLTEPDVAMLDARAAARDAFDELVAAADGWGAPDPIAGAMTAWSFDDAQVQIDAARAWLTQRDAFLADLAAAGLSAPQRLQQAYRTHGGGADAEVELNAEREVADSYVATAAAVNGDRSFVARVGLIGGPDPAQQLRLANGRFADGDLSGSLDAIGNAQQILGAAEAGGMARLASAVVVVVVLLAIAIFLVRRRAAYTPPR